MLGIVRLVGSICLLERIALLSYESASAPYIVSNASNSLGECSCVESIKNTSKMKMRRSGGSCLLRNCDLEVLGAPRWAFCDFGMKILRQELDWLSPPAG